VPDQMPLMLLLLPVALLWLIVQGAERPTLVRMATKAVVRQLQRHCCRLACRWFQELRQVHLASVRLVPEVVPQMELPQPLRGCHRGSCCLAALLRLLQMG
jgi:hypothetical protein